MFQSLPSRLPCSWAALISIEPHMRMWGKCALVLAQVAAVAAFSYAPPAALTANRLGL